LVVAGFDLNDQLELHISIILSPDWLYRIHLRLDQPVDRKSITADLSSDDRVVIVQLNKLEQSIWNKIGTSLNLNDSLCEMTLADKFFRPSQLVSKKQLTHDTYLFEFKLDNTLMYVPIGWHVLIREHVSTTSLAKQSTGYDDTRIYKNYTPVLPKLSDHDGLLDESGFMSSLYFIIKIYPDGVITGKLNQLTIGDIVDISDYQCVDFDVENSVRPPKKHWIILAAGTGITPFCRIIPHLLSQPDDLVETVTLVFFNKTQEDIILKDEFKALVDQNRNRFKVVHVLSNEPEKRPSQGSCNVWNGKRGKISKDLLAEFVDSKSPDELQMLACGPRAFTQLTKSISNELNLLEKLYIFHG
jgi:cytochrome-b5 reductase